MIHAILLGLMAIIYTGPFPFNWINPHFHHHGHQELIFGVSFIRNFISFKPITISIITGFLSSLIIFFSLPKRPKKRPPFIILSALFLIVIGLYQIISNGFYSFMGFFLVLSGLNIFYFPFPVCPMPANTSISSDKNAHIPLFSTLFTLWPIALYQGANFPIDSKAALFLVLLGLILSCFCAKSSIFLEKKAIFFAILGSIFISFFIFTEDPGILPDEKNFPLILFDGKHSLENLELKYDTNPNNSFDYGHANLINILKMQGYTVKISKGDDFKENLSKAHILAVIMPQLPFDDGEIQDIVARVKDGMGLLIIGDHTNIYGNMDCINPLAQHFNMGLNFDTVWTSSTSRQSLNYAGHPVLSGIMDIHFSVGASIFARYPAKTLIWSKYDLHGDMGDENAPEQAFLGNNHFDKGEKAGYLPLMGISRFGQGRVALFGDSAYFQNALYYRNLDLIDSLFSWLYRENLPWARLFLIPGAFFYLISLFSKKGNFANTPSLCRELFILPSAFILALSLILSTPVANSSLKALIGNYYQNPNIKKTMALDGQIIMDNAHANEIITYWDNHEHNPWHQDALFKAIVRMGFIPRVHKRDKLKHYLENARAYISVNPTRNHGADELKAISNFVENGGGLLLVDGLRKRGETPKIFSFFGFELGDNRLGIKDGIMEDGFIKRLACGNISATFEESIKKEPIKEELLQEKIMEKELLQENLIRNKIIKDLFFGMDEIRAVEPSELIGNNPLAFVGEFPFIGYKKWGKGHIIAISDPQFFANEWTETEEEIVDMGKLVFTWNLLDLIAGKPPKI